MKNLKIWFQSVEKVEFLPSTSPSSSFSIFLLYSLSFTSLLMMSSGPTNLQRLGDDGYFCLMGIIFDLIFKVKGRSN